MDEQPKTTRPKGISKDDQPKDAMLYGLGATSIAIVIVWFLTFRWM
jgi:hypothetical protein